MQGCLFSVELFRQIEKEASAKIDFASFVRKVQIS